MINICHIITNINYGGAQEIIKLLSKDNRVSIVVIAIQKVNESSSIVKFLRKNNVPIYSFFCITDLISALLSIIRADLLHVHLFPAFYIASIIPKKKIFTEHNTENKRRTKKYLWNLEKFIYSNYDCNCCISLATKNKLTLWLREEYLNIEVINNGIDLSEFFISERVLDPLFNRQKFNIAMAARFVEQKDQLTLIKSLLYLPLNFNLILIGNGPLLNNCIDYANKNNLLDRIFFLGWKDDVSLILDTVDIYVQSSNWEGFGLAVVEAMAKGLPVLGSDVCGLSEVIGNKEYLFESGNYYQLSNKIKYIFSSEMAYKQASSFSLKRSRMFSFKKMLEDYFSIYITTISS